MTVEQQFEVGLVHHRAGRLSEAEKIYRQILSKEPEQVDALHMLGALALQNGRFDGAIELMQRAIRILPNLAELHSNLGNALAGAKRPNEAIDAYRRALAIRPAAPEMHSNLGNALLDAGKPAEAIASHRRAISLRPDYAFAHNGLGNALQDVGEYQDAIASYRNAIRLRPGYADAYYNLGIALRAAGQLEEAIAAYRQAIAIRPDYAIVWSNLGNALNELGRSTEAIEALHRALSLKPDLVKAHFNLGGAFKDLRRFDEAMACYRQAIALQPEYAEAINNLGNSLKEIGDLDEAIAMYRKAAELAHDSTVAASNVLYTIQFHPGYDAGMILAEHRRFSEKYEMPLAQTIVSHENVRDPDRTLCVGYISPDFRDHCQSFFTIPLFSNQDRRLFEIYCYSDARRPDEITERILEVATVWRNIKGKTDEQVAQTIREDRIDVLIDLTMHMANGRPLLFARKPAPVQVAWLAYPGTTGLEAMDWRLTDPHLDPPETDSRYSEKSIRLPDSFWCYSPFGGEAAVSDLPSLKNGYITFGCLNNFCKVNGSVIKLWSDVLKAVDRSTLRILCPEGNCRQQLLKSFEGHGVSSNRIELTAYRPRPKYLELYHNIDIGLDTFPYNGHTTSLDSYWMGVPVVTLVGETVVGRAGLSQLTNLGLSELIARTPGEFVACAAGLAGDLPRLANLRRSLRERMKSSPLMVASRFARNFENALRETWRTYCGEKEDT